MNSRIDAGADAAGGGWKDTARRVSLPTVSRVCACTAGEANAAHIVISSHLLPFHRTGVTLSVIAACLEMARRDVKFGR